MDENLEKQIQELQRMIGMQVIRIAQNGSRIRVKAIAIRITLITLTFLVTIILGLGLQPWGNKVALVLSALIAAVTTWDSYAQYQRKLLVYVEMQTRIERLSSDISFFLSGKGNYDPAQLNEFIDRFNLLLDEFHAGSIQISTASLKPNIDNK